MFTYKFVFVVLSVIFLPCDIFSHKYCPYNLVLKNWVYISESKFHKVSFSQLRNTQETNNFSGFKLYSKLENMEPDQLFSNFESSGDTWLLDLTTNELELVLDQLRFLLLLQLKRHNELLSMPQTELSESLEKANELKVSEEFYNKLLEYILILLTKILEKKQLKFETDSEQIMVSNRFTELELIQREVHFLQEIKDFVRNLYFIFHCKGPLTKNSSLCNFLTNFYSDTQVKFLSKTKSLYEAYNKYENEWEDISEVPFVLKHKRMNRKSRLKRYKYKSKAKKINFRKTRLKSKTKSKLKSKIKSELKVK
ncbi:uncharacterized protein ELE39_000947 [Cryptosporidium sp. chipmunk genotype I]|uniref:uncharacterized protein n=1 Tax=Cryptosporidium sp. chipmunk genotype I TaxID=1280935 RepID=UPI00351A0B67|nr:hypothetical protein ELE39_000947 [Cryptosporidium sp. chipmunk genotype I]